MVEQKAFLDYRQAGDSGADDATSIRPYANGEYAEQTVLNRPLEHLRQRSEAVRAQVQDLLYYRDRGHVLFELTAGGTATWGGVVASGGSGVLTVSGTLKISPFAAPAAPVRGSLTTGASGANQLTYSLSSSTYASQGTSAITIEHRAATGQALSVVIGQGPVYHVLVQFDAANVNHTNSAAKAALDAAIAQNAFLAGKLQTAVNGTGILATLAETRISASADDESHWVLGTSLTNLTSVRKLSAGDGIGIWYKYLVEPDNDPVDPKGSVAGGRAESSVVRNNHNIPAGALFVTSDSASKIPGAIIICRVGYGGQLVFADGTRVNAGETTKFDSIPTAVNAVLGNYVTTTVFNSTIGNYSTTSAMNTAIATAVSNRATTSYVDTAVSGRATTSYVDNAVNNGIATRTTPAAVETQITNRLNSYTPPSGGVSQAYVDGQVATRTTPADVTAAIIAARTTGVPYLIESNYTLINNRNYNPSDVTRAFTFLVTAIDATGTLLHTTTSYSIGNILEPGLTYPFQTSSEWVYLYAFKVGSSTGIVASLTPPFSYYSRTASANITIPSNFGGGTLTVGQGVCFGCLLCWGNTFAVQSCADKVLGFSYASECNRIFNATGSLLQTSFPANFFPANARNVVLETSAYARLWYPNSDAYAPNNIIMDLADTWSRRTHFSLAGVQKSQIGIELNINSRLFLREVYV